jgi:hypothetical protein
VIATALAAFYLSAFIAIGSSILPRRLLGREEIGPSAAIVVGSGLTAFVYAVLARLGFVDAAIAIVAACSVLAVFVKREAIALCASSIGKDFRTAFSASRFLRVLSFPVAALLWIYSIAPPRDGDVMRYHLAHIRQIIRDGRWETIPDYHYAFPFGWTLNYLPFERLHIPQAAALINTGLWIVIVAGLLRLAASSRVSATARLGALALFVHPFVMRTFASAMADAYAILVVFAIGALVLSLDEFEIDDFVLIGFVSWIGVQSRYQSIAWGIAATVVVAVFAVRRKALSSLPRFGAGAAAALFLALPFYIANARGLGNPVWPLLVRKFNGTTEYADKVAVGYTDAMTGTYDPGYMARQAWELVSTASLFPIAVIVVGIIIGCLAIRERRFRRLAMLGALFLLLWEIAEPKLFPRHVLLLLPIAAMLCVPLSDWSSRWRMLSRAQLQLSGFAIIVFVALAAVFANDYARYAVTGDAKTFHRFTWYYPSYDWVNHSTPEDARFLVITYSGHSYYLDRAYRRADPWLSGVVDWSSIHSGYDLVRFMKAHNYNYVIYDDRDWSGFAGGAEMQSAMKDATTTGPLHQVNFVRERLYTSRAMRDYDETGVIVFHLEEGSAQ